VIGPNADNREMQWGSYHGFNWVGTTSILEGIRKYSPNATFDQGCDYVNETVAIDLWEQIKNSAGEVGLDGEFWTNGDFLGPTAFKKRIERLRWHDSGDVSIGGGQNWNYSARFSGTFKSDRAEVLEIRVEWRYGVNVTIGNITRDEMSKQADYRLAPRISFKVAVEAGDIPFRVEYYHGIGEAVIDIAIMRLTQNNTAVAIEKAKSAEVIVFVGGINGSLEGEEMSVNVEGFSGGDRTQIELPRVQRELLEALKATGKKIVFVLCAGSAVAFNTTGLSAVVDAFYPGEAGGRAVADVLFGAYNPAGRLPVTFYKSTADLPNFTDYNMTQRTYRYFTGEPLWPFGHGLSYTTFAYQNLRISATTIGQTVRVSFGVRNTGALDGDEVSQVYVTALRKNCSAEPIKSLKWFTRTRIAATALLSIDADLPPSAFEVFNDEFDTLQVLPGDFKVCVGGSSFDASLLCSNITLTTFDSTTTDTPIFTIIIAALAAILAILAIILVSIFCRSKNDLNDPLMN
jgi:beta-glucosidase